MATLQASIAVTIRDEPGERTAASAYFTFPDTLTLAQTVTYLQTLISRVDAVTDGVVDRARLSLTVPLPGGIKTTPATGSDNEETGLFTFKLTDPGSKSWAFDVPAIAQAVLQASSPNRIDLTNTDVQNLVTYFTSSGAGTPTNNVWSSTLSAIRTALKTFRKHRRQAKRV
jgi:hypothetical protein